MLEKAKKQGTTVSANGKCWWWLISPAGPSAKGVDYFGVASNDGAKVSKVYYAVRPAMWIDLSAFEEPQEPVVSEEISIGDVVTFGSYEQDNNLENGAEPIEWQVLDIQDGKALAISKYVLDAKPYVKVFLKVKFQKKDGIIVACGNG